MQQQLATILGQADSPFTRDMTTQDKLALRAALKLKTGDYAAVLHIIKDADRQDPLLAVIKAEAYRQLATQALSHAGHYGQTLQEERKRLQGIELDRGLAEAYARLQALARKVAGSRGVPLDVLQLGPSVKNIFLVDKEQARLYVYHADQQGRLILDADEYAVSGTNKGDKQSQGDKRTPNGVYRLVQRLDDPALRARYGPLAFPLDYPNELDRLHGKTGSGIWLHGYQQHARRRPPQDTLGCVALPNDRLLKLADCIKIHHSWILIAEHIAMGDDKVRRQQRDNVLATLRQWAADWSSRDHARYIAHYAKNFRSGKRRLDDWSRYKQRVNSRKTFIQVTLSDITLIHDPQPWPEGEVVVAEFQQQYKSSNLNSSGRKRLYLVRQQPDDAWKILMEVSLTS